jgi:hypothetical protein
MGLFAAQLARYVAGRGTHDGNYVSRGGRFVLLPGSGNVGKKWGHDALPWFDSLR